MPPRTAPFTTYIQQLSDKKRPVALHTARGSTGLYGVFSSTFYGQNATRDGSLTRVLYEELQGVFYQTIAVSMFVVNGASYW